MISKKFITFVSYHPQLFLMDRESHYHFGVCYAMLDAGYEVEMVSFGDSVKIENDPNYDPRIKVTYKNSIFDSLRYLWKNRDALIYANTFILPSLLVGLIGKRTIFFSHSSVFPGSSASYRFLKNIFIKFCYHFFTKIRVINEYEIDWLAKEGFNSKGIYIPLVVSERNHRINSASFPSILLLGRITAIKDPKTILIAISIVVRKYPNIQIYQVGEYNEYRDISGKSYIELLSEYGLDKNFILLGQKKLSEVNVPTSIYINSSLSEGQCLALYDAVVMGNAVCAPSISSFKGVLNGNILYHNTGDFRKLAENIAWYIEHPKELEEQIRLNQKWTHDHHNFEFIQKQIKREFSKI